MAVSPNAARLGCGRLIDDVWAGIGRPPDAHERTCPDCRRARADLGRLAALTAEQRRADLVEEDLQPDPQVLDAILRVARAEVRRGRRLPLDEPDRAELVPTLTVSEQAVAAVVRHAGDETPGVQVRRVRVELVQRQPPPPPSVEEAGESAAEPEALGLAGRTESSPARVAVFLQISVAASAFIPVLARALRGAVREAVENEVGMIAVRVDVRVEDVHGG